MSKNQIQIGMLIQQCHRLRQKRKQCLEQAKQTVDFIEKERLIQTAEHYSRSAFEEQTKIDLNSKNIEEIDTIQA